MSQRDTGPDTLAVSKEREQWEDYPSEVRTRAIVKAMEIMKDEGHEFISAPMFAEALEATKPDTIELLGKGMARALSEEQMEVFAAHLSPEDVDPPEMSTNETVVREINKRVVAPLLLGTGVLLFAAAIGAALNGSLILAALIIPVPIATAYFLWKMRNL